jgi:hypothetical protein
MVASYPMPAGVACYAQGKAYSRMLLPQFILGEVCIHPLRVSRVLLAQKSGNRLAETPAAFTGCTIHHPAPLYDVCSAPDLVF